MDNAKLETLLDRFPFLCDTDVGNGWYDLLYKMAECIEKLQPNSDFKFVQIKEKFGLLRSYFDNGAEEIALIVDNTESESATTCEDCGSAGRLVRKTDYWVKTLCPACHSGPEVKFKRISFRL